MNAAATLVLAWGNPGRRDDGLGPAFAEAIRDRGVADLAVSADYQLQVEDAAELCGCARVLFVDADRAGPGPFRFHRLEPEAGGQPRSRDRHGARGAGGRLRRGWSAAVRGRGGG